MTAPALEGRAPHLVFSSGGAVYAVSSERAAEVVGFSVLTPVPGSPAHLLGIFAHRGEVVPLIDVPRLVGGSGGQNSAATARRAVLLLPPKGPLALTAFTVAGVVNLEGSLSPLGTEGVAQCLFGPAQTEYGAATVIDADRLFDYLSQPSSATPS